MLNGAQSIQHTIRGKTTLATCGCHYEEKKHVAVRCRMDLIQESDMGFIARMLMEHYNGGNKDES